MPFPGCGNVWFIEKVKLDLLLKFSPGFSKPGANAYPFTAEKVTIASFTFLVPESTIVVGWFSTKGAGGTNEGATFNKVAFKVLGVGPTATWGSPAGGFGSANISAVKTNSKLFSLSVVDCWKYWDLLHVSCHVS